MTSTVGVDEAPPKTRLWIRIVLGVVIAGLAAMWIYAFAFASRDNVNALGDKAWAEQAEIDCAAAHAEIRALPSSPNITDKSAEALAARSEVLSQSNVILEELLAELASPEPNDVEGARIAKLWLGDYQTYVNDRKAYAEGLKAGDVTAFAESVIDGMPITGFIDDVARQNRMPSCQAPLLS
jgi:hypothetical protein